MKKIAAIAILLLFVMLAWDVLEHTRHFDFHIDGEDIDGPLAALLALVFGGGGLLVAVVVMLVAGLLMAVLFASLGILAVAGLGIGAMAAAAIVFPLLLPLLVLIGIIWLLKGRSRRNRHKPDPV